MDGSKLVRGKVLGVAITLARHLQRTYPDQQRIGVVLPPGKGGLVANLAVILAGKIPVNLNFTAGQTVPNLVVGKLGTGGQLSLYNSAGSTHVIADVSGWFDLGCAHGSYFRSDNVHVNRDIFAAFIDQPA